MKIAMLARNAKLYTHKRLKAAAEERGHTLDIINTLRCYMNIASHRPEVYYNGEKAEKHAPLTIFSFDTHDPPKEQTVYSGDLFYVK